MAKAVAAGADPGRRWLVVHPGATAPSRRYPLASFAAALRLLESPAARRAPDRHCGRDRRPRRGQAAAGERALRGPASRHAHAAGAGCADRARGGAPRATTPVRRISPRPSGRPSSTCTRSPTRSTRRGTCRTPRSSTTSPVAAASRASARSATTCCLARRGPGEGRRCRGGALRRGTASAPPRAWNESAMITLGINAAYHDSSACLVRDGAVVAAAEEERFTQIKHGKRPVPFSAWELPHHAIDYCLAEAGLELADVDHVAYSYDPALIGHGGEAEITLPLEPSAAPPSDARAGRGTRCSARTSSTRRASSCRARPITSTPASAPRARALGHYRWHFVDHHLCHQASAFLAGPDAEAAVLTLDGRGEIGSTQYGMMARRALPAAGRSAAAALARAALRAGDPPSRLPALLRRVQGDGARLDGRARVPAADASTACTGSARGSTRSSRCRSTRGCRRVAAASRWRRRISTLPPARRWCSRRWCCAIASWLQHRTGGVDAGDGGRRGAQLRDEREAARRGDLRRGLGAARCRRCRDRARRGAVDRPARAARAGAGRRACVDDGRRLPRSGVRRGGDREGAAGSAGHVHAPGFADGDGRRRAGQRAHRRLVPGTDGIRSACAGGPLHPRLADARSRCSSG